MNNPENPTTPRLRLHAPHMKLLPRRIRFMRRLTTPGGLLSPIQHREWLLLLNARSLPHTVVRISGVEHIFVPVLVENIARHEIAAFSRENRQIVTPSPPWPAHTLWQFAPIYLLPLVILHACLPASLIDAAILDGARLRFHGEWYRLVTALTLHTNWAHLAGNLFFGSIFLALLARICGLGHAWLLTLCAGIAGNCLNTAIHVPGYQSVGFSTAIFGCVGILAGVHICRASSQLLKPLAASLAILALLGTAGEHTDYGAHICGLAAGILLGAIEGYAILHQKTILPQWLAAILAWFIPTAVWYSIAF